MIETYFENANATIEKLHSMYDRMLNTAENISMEFIADEDSVEVDVNGLSADDSRFQTSVVTAKEALKQLTIGISQAKARFDTLSNTVERRRAQLQLVDKAMASIAERDTYKNAEQIVEEVTKTKQDFASLKSQYPDFTDEQISILLAAEVK